MDKYLECYQNCKLFLVTEDYRYFKILKRKYKDQLLTVSFDTFIENYDGKNFLSKANVLNNDVKKRGQDYLIKIILLSKCRFLISSMTMGSIAAYALNGGRYQSTHIFNLGKYK